jgi:hypothetical protein
MSYKYQAVYYRNTHYTSAEEAKQGKALKHWEETYGYSSTMDAFTNAVDLMNAYDPTIIKEFTFIWTIDNVVFPERDAIDSYFLLKASYDYFIKEGLDVLKTGTEIKSN